MHIKQICVIGAGISGLATAKTFLEAGYDVTVFEKQKELGGVWEKSRTYPGLTTQTTSDTFCFSDYPMPESYPEWPTGEQMQNYLLSYAKHFGVIEKIRFLSTVTDVQRKTGDKPGWIVTVEVKDGERGQPKHQKQEFDFVVVCNGTFNIPKIPSLPGASDFTTSGGKILHSSELNDISEISGKKVVVVGFGKSAIDIAICAADTAKECTIVFREAVWKLPKFFLGRVNIKNILLTRFAEAWLPYRKLRGVEQFLHGVGKPLVWAFWRTNEMLVRRQLRLDACGMVPSRPLYHVDCSTNLAPDGFFESVISGKIKAKKTRVARFIPGGVELANGDRLQADIVIFATGFRQDISFLAEKYRQLVMDEQKNFHLYRHLIHPEVPQMGFVGYNTSFFSQLTSEVGSWWLLEYVQGNLVLPELSQMYLEIDAELDWINTKLSYSTVSGACITPFSLRYLDQLMEDMGATSQHSVWKGIPEIIKPVNPSLYNQLRQELKAQKLTNVNDFVSDQKVAGSG